MSEQIKKQIAANLKQLRKAAGYRSGKQFAEANDIAVQTYLNHESGKRGMSISALFSYASLLNCGVDKIISGNDKQLMAYIAGIQIRAVLGSALEVTPASVAMSYDDYVNNRIGMDTEAMAQCIEEMMPSVLAVRARINVELANAANKH